MSNFRNILILSFLLLAFLPAAPVDKQKAQMVAERFYPEKTVTECKTVTDHLYLNIFEDGGFVLVPADDRFPPVLAYSGSSPAAHSHPAFIAHCGAYNTEIRQALSLPETPHHDWELYLSPGFAKPTVTSEVSPLITSTWDQAPYYNDHFPEFAGSSTKAYAGCVAVVMGQLMNYYEHPANGFGLRSYYDAGTDSLLSSRFDTSYYAWETMPNELSGTSTADQIKNVSSLLYQCAVSIEMEFKTDGSYGSYDDMMFALTSYFDYHPDMHQENRSDHETQSGVWTSMLKDELDGGHPVAYRGQGDEGGHAYLCDGYQITDSQTYFHINWGWGGSYDGWFLLSALAPTQNVNFSDMQGAVFGIRPNTDAVTRLAYNGFEGKLKGWVYGGEGFYTISYSGKYAYGVNSAKRWLISPKIHIPDNDNAVLSVWAKAFSQNRRCRVLISFTDTLPASFTIELGVISTLNTNWTEYNYNLRSFKNNTVHIGFQYDSNLDFIAIDDFLISMPAELTGTGTSVPEDHYILENYPNPFNPATNIRFSFSSLQNAEVRLMVFNARGELVHNLTGGQLNAGQYETRWDASSMPSGIYICMLQLNGRPVMTRKMLLLK